MIISSLLVSSEEFSKVPATSKVNDSLQSIALQLNEEWHSLINVNLQRNKAKPFIHFFFLFLTTENPWRVELLISLCCRKALCMPLWIWTKEVKPEETTFLFPLSFCPLKTITKAVKGHKYVYMSKSSVQKQPKKTFSYLT